MRHPLTGGGMSVALNDVMIWRSLLQNVPDLSDNAALSQVKSLGFYSDKPELKILKRLIHLQKISSNAILLQSVYYYSTRL